MLAASLTPNFMVFCSYEQVDFTESVSPLARRSGDQSSPQPQNTTDEQAHFAARACRTPRDDGVASAHPVFWAAGRGQRAGKGAGEGDEW